MLSGVQYEDSKGFILLLLMMVFDYQEETKSPDTELLYIVPVLTQLTVAIQLT